MAIDGIDCIDIGNGDMIRLDSNKISMGLMCLVNCEITSPESCFPD